MSILRGMPKDLLRMSSHEGRGDIFTSIHPKSWSIDGIQGSEKSPKITRIFGVSWGLPWWEEGAHWWSNTVTAHFMARVSTTLSSYDRHLGYKHDQNTHTWYLQGKQRTGEPKAQAVSRALALRWSPTWISYWIQAPWHTETAFKFMPGF